MPTPSPQRVATRSQTRQTQELQVLADNFTDRLMEGARGLVGWNRKPVPPGSAAAIRPAAKAFYDKLDLQFESERDAAGLKKYTRRVKNLRKMVAPYQTVANEEEFKEIFLSQSSKSKSAWVKIHDYVRELMALITTFDSEGAGNFRVGGMRVALVQQGGGVWDDEMVEKLKAVLTKTIAFLKPRGLGALTQDLTVFAFPTAGIPGMARAGAYYNRVKDIVAISVGSNWFRKTPVSRMVQTMVHELGHRAYFQTMGGPGRTSWEAFFEDMQEPPDVDEMIRKWDAWVYDADDDREKRRRSHFEVWYQEMRKHNHKEEAQWLLMAVQSLDLESGEKFNNRSGLPTPSSVAALDVFKARKNEVTVFAEPVTPYSATSATELFAEVFAHYIAHGPRTLSPKVRDQLQRSLPKLKIGSADPKRVAAAYSGNADGDPIYPNEIDHGYEKPISGGSDVMKDLVKDLRREQGGREAGGTKRMWEMISNVKPLRDGRTTFQIDFPVSTRAAAREAGTAAELFAATLGEGTLTQKLDKPWGYLEYTWTPST